MKRIAAFSKGFFAVAVLGILLFAGTVSGQAIKDFTLRNTDGKMVALGDYKDAKGCVVIFTCNHCPFAKLYPPRLNDLYAKYTKLGVPVIAISSTDTVVYEGDSYAAMVKKAKDEKFLFPYLYDNTQQVARMFKAQKTPHAFVIWKENGNWVVKYSGAIDDNGAEPAKVKHRYVSDAVDQLLAGKPVKTPETRSIGCQINLRNN